MFELMLQHFGPQQWWPGDSPLEMMTGAILTQNTNWTNVEKAIGNLKDHDKLSIHALNNISIEELAVYIKPAGYFNVKAKRLKNLVRFIIERYDGDIDKFIIDNTDSQREGLLSVKGIGPETADSILLYAADKPSFVIDAYTYRILARHNMADDQTSYDELQTLFMDNLKPDAALFNEFHALIVKTGKEYCRKRPLCNICPLGKWE